MDHYFYRPDSNRFPAYQLTRADGEAGKHRVYTQNRPVAAEWVPPKLNGFSDNPVTATDFPSLNNYSDLPLVSPRAWELLEPTIGRWVEPLPAELPTGEIYFFLHVLDATDALDQSRSEFSLYPDGGKMSKIRQYAFHDEMIVDKPIFRLPSFCLSEVIVDDRFREIVETNNLPGLIFSRVPKV